MKVEPVRGPKFAALVKRFGGGTPVFPTPVLEGLDAGDPLAILLTNYLLWESSLEQATEALARISRVVVDANDLRVMLESEVREVIGEKYPYVDERAGRLRATLNDIFRRQHRTSLDHLRNASRKDQRSYLDGLADIPPFVAGRTLLVAFELPAPVVDDTTVELLHQNGAVEPTATTAEVSAWIGRHHRIEELPRVHHALGTMVEQAWKSSGRQGTRIRKGYLDRHAKFHEAEESERRRIEEEKLAKIREAERVAEERRLAEIAREEERQRMKREAEEAKIRARAEREAARVAAIEERARKAREREAERVAREKERARLAIERAKEAARRDKAREAAARKAAVLRERRERQQAQLKARREKQAALAAARKKKLETRKAALKKAALKKAALKKAALKKAALKKATLKKSAKKQASSRKPAARTSASRKPAPKKRAAKRGSSVRGAAKKSSRPKSGTASRAPAKRRPRGK